MLKALGREYISNLIGEPIIDFGRATDMAWISLGKTFKVKNHKNEETEKSTFAIHLQCPWRMIQGHGCEILFASHDIYVPNTMTEWNEDFDWDVQGINLFDEKVSRWKSDNIPAYVVDLQYSNLGDLKLILSNNNILEVFINTSSNNECWRFFECGVDKEHLVVSGNNDEFQ